MNVDVSQTDECIINVWVFSLRGVESIWKRKRKSWNGFAAVLAWSSQSKNVYPWNTLVEGDEQPYRPRQ